MADYAALAKEVTSRRAKAKKKAVVPQQATAKQRAQRDLFIKNVLKR